MWSSLQFFLCALLLHALSGCANLGAGAPPPKPVAVPKPVVVEAAPPSPAAMPTPVPVPPTIAKSAPPALAPGNLDRNVKLWYGTSRKETQPFVRFAPYTAERNQKLNYGTCEVLVPKSHQKGSIGGTYYERLQGIDAPLVFTHATRLAQDKFWNDLTLNLKAINTRDKVVLVFIHGFNNSFEDAAIRTAQLWVDLGLNGIPAFFSWPSRNKVMAYTADEATIDYSEKFLEQFLLDLRSQVGPAQPIHLIAHSMGNRALLRVANKVKDKLRFGQIILAAPDVDMDVFRELSSAYSHISERTTLYVSTKDVPVRFSKEIHHINRVGSPPKFIRAEGIDTVEVMADRGLLELGHSYFAEFIPTLLDMESLIKTNPSRNARYVGQRTDRNSECLKNSDDDKTQSSCWQLKPRH
ncbi:MAG: alpha/beta fold hydrolase [Pseudomonadota bacterium]|nr:alpha/beta fold hydrolase [Pseudomonadota bacterium]